MKTTAAKLNGTAEEQRNRLPTPMCAFLVTQNNHGDIMQSKKSNKKTVVRRGTPHSDPQCRWTPLLLRKGMMQDWTRTNQRINWDLEKSRAVQTTERQSNCNPYFQDFDLQLSTLPIKVAKCTSPPFCTPAQRSYLWLTTGPSPNSRGEEIT